VPRWRLSFCCVLGVGPHCGNGRTYLFRVGIFDLLEDTQRLLVQLHSSSRLPETGVGVTEVEEGVALAPATRDLSGDLEVLLVHLDGPARLPEEVVGGTEVAQGGALASAISVARSSAFASGNAPFLSGSRSVSPSRYSCTMKWVMVPSSPVSEPTS